MVLPLQKVFPSRFSSALPTLVSGIALNNNSRAMLHLQNIKPLIGSYKVQSGNATILFYIFSMLLSEKIA